MSAPSLIPPPRKIIYPENDGMPMAENTVQFEWIVVIKLNLERLYRDIFTVFIAADLFWYPVEGDNATRQAPDVMVVFGRPKGDRGSYRQWEEGGIAPHVVFEILSPGNRLGEMNRKFQFYDQHGVEEYYIYDPERNDLTGSRRVGDRLIEIPTLAGWVSPRLGIRFEINEEKLQIFYPDGRPFLTFLELDQLREEAERRATEAQRRAERLAAQLRALGVEPDA